MREAVWETAKPVLTAKTSIARYTGKVLAAFYQTVVLLNLVE